MKWVWRNAYAPDEWLSLFCWVFCLFIFGVFLFSKDKNLSAIISECQYNFWFSCLYLNSPGFIARPGFLRFLLQARAFKMSLCRSWTFLLFHVSLFYYFFFSSVCVCLFSKPEIYKELESSVSLIGITDIELLQKDTIGWKRNLYSGFLFCLLFRVGLPALAAVEFHNTDWM